MTGDRYRSAGWLVLPGTPRWPLVSVHRCDPDDPAKVMCGRLAARGTPPAGGEQPTRQCPPCAAAVGRRRRRDRAQRDKHLRERRALERAQASAAARGGSLWAYSAGLPGLGKR